MSALSGDDDYGASEARGRRRSRPEHQRPKIRHCSRCLHSSDSEPSEDEATPSQRRNVTFALPRGSPGHTTTISGGMLSSVGGSQSISTTNHHTDTYSNGLINVSNVHIHINIGNSKAWVLSVGLFGGGDSMFMRCT
ncbi:hypothetical protein BT96DRAFT_917574 [Gymnopus androsaceus JB14]|uniref:Uncharacterized protein n=1 Tax=Gymnopus androsaceus JB14 TaxID=1447944 RepID=A0A6A4I2A5_9AGAR|nr:hypothetical protein BT96DRAFT_917574 [Gymnopus androsaceus JB14]